MRINMKKVIGVGFVIVMAGSTLLSQAKVTIFEGARVIVGDGRTLDNATIVVQGDRISQARSISRRRRR